MTKNTNEESSIDCSWYKSCVHYNEFQRLKKENEELKENYNANIERSNQVGELYRKYKKCLEEIKQHCQEEASKLNWTASDILQKINEVLDEK